MDFGGAVVLQSLVVFQSFAKLWCGLFKHILVALELPEIPKKMVGLSVLRPRLPKRCAWFYIIRQKWWWFPRFGIDCDFQPIKSWQLKKKIVSRASSKVDQKNNKHSSRSSFLIQGKPLLSSGTLCRRASFCIHSSLGQVFFQFSNGFGQDLSPT